MDRLYIKQTTDTPEVVLDPEKGELRFKGVCMPENPNLFFQDIIAWVESYVATPASTTLVEFELDYLNSMTIKYLFNILSLFKKVETPPVINWKYKKNDLLMIEKGIEFEYITKLKLNMIEI